MLFCYIYSKADEYWYMFMCTKFDNETVYDNSAGLLLKCNKMPNKMIQIELYGYYSHSYLTETGEQGNV